METLVSGKQKKRKREEAAESLAAPDATTLTSHVSEGKQACTTLASHVSEGKQSKKRKKKRHPAAEEDPGARHGAHQHAPHVGVDRTNSNWKQLQAVGRKSAQSTTFSTALIMTLKKGQGARKNHKEQAAGADVTEPGKFRMQRAEDVTQRPLQMLSPRNEDCSLTKVLAMDCEMVGAGMDGKRSILARVSLVNMWGNVVYDKHVRPKEQVTDYRTKISGVRASNLRKGEDFAVVQKKVADLILGRVLVGHSLRNDLKIMYLSHPKKDTRDTAAYPPLRNTNGRPRALRHIAEELLGVKIQVGEHCSVQDARAAMYIYKHLKRDWERTMSKRR